MPSKKSLRSVRDRPPAGRKSLLLLNAPSRQEDLHGVISCKRQALI